MLVARRRITFTSSSIRNYQVTILGAASELGQTISLLLRGQPSITKLVIHDIHKQNQGVAIDLSHVPSKSCIAGYTGEETLVKALKKSDIVIATGGTPRTPGMTQKMWFLKNSDYIKRTAPKIAKVHPFPFVGIVTEPINSIVPMAAEIMKRHGNFNGKKLFGITTIDYIRAQCLFANENKLKPKECKVPVIGGRSNKTIIPLLSQSKPTIEMEEKLAQEFTTKLRSCDEVITNAKSGWSPTLAVAYSVLCFVRALIDALDSRQTKVSAFVENNDFGTSFFGGITTIDKNGVHDMQRFTKLSAFEIHLLENSIKQLRDDVERGKKMLQLISN